MPTLLNLALYFVLAYILYYSLPLFFVHVHVLIILLLHMYKEGPLQISTMY